MWAIYSEALGRRITAEDVAVPRNSRVHAVPDHDPMPHTMTMECDCGPQPDSVEPMIIRHKARRAN